MASPSLPFRSVEQQFTARSGSIYGNMVARFQEKRNKNGRITRIGYVVPFTRDEFRDWLREQLGGEGGVRKCAYCSTYVSAADMAIDHMTPPKRGGSLGLENLAIACEPCNQIKGGMLSQSYMAFRAWALLNIDPECCKDLFKRLQSQMKLATMQRWELAKKFRQKKQQQPTESTDEKW
jgi:hypothetical protein